MFKRALLLLTAAATVLFCTGCAKMLESEYVSVTPYEEKKTAAEEHGAENIDVNSYAGLRSMLMSLVENCTEHTVFTVRDYDSVIGDMSKACMEVTRNTAIGIYAVDYMTHSYTKYPGYYEMELYITYKRSVEELFSIKRAGSVAEAVDMLRGMLASGEKNMVMQVNSSIVGAEYLCRQLDELYYSMPDKLLLKPVLTATEYFGSSNDKIIELKADYLFAEDSAERRMTMLLETADALCAEAAGDTQAERLAQVCSAAFENAGNLNVYYSLALEKTAFDAICAGSANPEGVAMGVQLLCSKLGLESAVVFGQKGRREYAWNVVTVDGEAVYVDALREDIYIGNVEKGELLPEYLLRGSAPWEESTERQEV